MRTKNEIRQAVAILRHKGDRISMLQAATLEKGRNEAWVFATYVTSVPEEAKDETAFYACRDAARFVTGHIGLEELVPDVQSMTAADFAAAGALGMMDAPKPKKERQTVSVQEFEALKRKVKQLEGFMEDLLKERRQRAEYQKLPDTNRADFIGQKEATELIGCTRETLGAWQRKGFITGYRKAGLVYYSKSELAASPVVQNFITIKKGRR